MKNQFQGTCVLQQLLLVIVIFLSTTLHISEAIFPRIVHRAVIAQPKRSALTSSATKNAAIAAAKVAAAKATTAAKTTATPTTSKKRSHLPGKIASSSSQTTRGGAGRVVKTMTARQMEAFK